MARTMALNRAMTICITMDRAKAVTMEMVMAMALAISNALGFDMLITRIRR